MNQLRTIHLEGQLKEVCGGQSSVQLVGDNLHMIINGLASMYGPQVKQIVRENNWHVLVGDDDQEGVHQDDVHNKLAANQDVYIFPQIEGAGKVFNIIVGIILIVAGIYTAFYGNPTSAEMISGGMMILSGINMIVTALNTPSASKNRAVDENPSFIFNGAANVIEQGGAVPCVYGRFRTGSVVVSAGIDSEQLTSYTSPTSGNPAGNGVFTRFNTLQEA